MKTPLLATDVQPISLGESPSGTGGSPMLPSLKRCLLSAFGIRASFGLRISSFGFILLLALATDAAPRASDNYASPIESLSFGGGRQTSAAYTAYSSIGEIGGIQASAAYYARNAFIGQFTLAPGSAALSDNSVLEKEPEGTVIGQFTALDPEPGETYAFQFVSGDGDDDNDSFSIEDGVLKTAVEFDYRTRNSYNIRVRATDTWGLFVETAFVIEIEVINQPPLAWDVSLERGPGGSASVSVFKLLQSAFDPDGDPLTLSDFETASEEGGTVTQDATWLIYLPPGSDPENDSFGFTVSDGLGGTAQARVRITIRAIDDQPSRNITRVMIDGDDVVLHFVGIPGQSYYIEYTTDLNNPDWIELGTGVAATNGRFQFRDESPGGATRFYRAVVR